MNNVFKALILALVTAGSLHAQVEPSLRQRILDLKGINEKQGNVCKQRRYVQECVDVISLYSDLAAVTNESDQSKYEDTMWPLTGSLMLTTFGGLAFLGHFAASSGEAIPELLEDHIIEMLKNKNTNLSRFMSVKGVRKGEMPPEILNNLSKYETWLIKIALKNKAEQTFYIPMTGIPSHPFDIKKLPDVDHIFMKPKGSSSVIEVIFKKVPHKIPVINKIFEKIALTFSEKIALTEVIIEASHVPTKRGIVEKVSKFFLGSYASSSTTSFEVKVLNATRMRYGVILPSLLVGGGLAIYLMTNTDGFVDRMADINSECANGNEGCFMRYYDAHKNDFSLDHLQRMFEAVADLALTQHE